MVFIKYLSSKTSDLIYFSNPLNIIVHNTIYLNCSDFLNQEICDILRINEAFELGRSPSFRRVSLITKKTFAYFLKVYSLNLYVIDDAKSIASFVNRFKVINSNFLMVISILIKEFYNLFDVYL
jgi:hypothetical protein